MAVKPSSQTKDAPCFEPTKQPGASVLQGSDGSIKTVFHRGEFVELKGCRMKVIDVRRKTLVLRPV